MLQTILVPVDGSRFAEAALPHAKRLARSADSTIRLALVHHIMPAWNPGMAFPDGGASMERETRQREERYLANLAAAVAAESGRPVETALLDGSPGEALVQYAGEVGADLVVMATHGRGPASRFWLGSTTDYVLRNAGVPLLAIRPDGDGAQPGGVPSVRRILVPVDSSALSQTVVAPAAEFARLLEAELVLLTVVEPAIGTMDPALPFPSAIDPAVVEAQRTQAQATLERIAAPLREAGLSVETRVAVALGVAASILEVLDRDGIDMIAMSTHGEGGLRRAFIGSVTDKVIRGAQKPVLAWRPRNS
jgi:nucleotide-binding universal stress UspA family protein